MITKLVGLIRDLKIYVHNIPYVITFIVLYNSLMGTSYSMLIGKPWLRDAKVTHNWGNKTMTILRIGLVVTIVVIKHLGIEVKRQKNVVML
jgi:hypothetical protein